MKKRDARCFRVPPLRGAVRGPLSYLSSVDLLTAMGTAGTRPRSTRKAKMCRTCGVLYPPADIRPDLDEEGNRRGWVCFGCE